MLKGLFKLSWIETKVFMREPMGVVGTLFMPIVFFLIMARFLRGVPHPSASIGRLAFNATILSSLLIVLSAVQSLIAIMAIYREGGILKRLRATPLAPVTILSAHVLVKLGLTLTSFLLLVLAGKRAMPGAMPEDMVGFAASILLATLGILGLGFLVASVVPTARFAQPLGALVFYPMLALSGLFFPLARMPLGLRAVAEVLPTTHAVTLLRGAYDGTPWSAQWGSVAALLAMFALCLFLATKWFRWE
ncbi:MAG TPA: ABC transporter permease [Gemmatimonadaceae bacterium]